MQIKRGLKVLLLTCFSLVLAACSTSGNKEINNEKEGYMGNKSAENELFFVFDYSCSWCTKWMIEVFPEIKEFTEDGNVKFKTQSVVFLNENSLKLAKLDQLLKEEYPNDYFDVMTTIVTEAESNENWGSEGYLIDTLKQHNIDDGLLSKEPKVDVVEVTEELTKEMDIEFVPTLFVNGIKVDDAFDTKGIMSYLQ